MYLESILWYLTYPALIIASYYFAVCMVKKYEKNTTDKDS